ncbi:hypothetical protein RRG08_049892 [Elysia crispata]|uniref:Uncharacterized protein n=1 Tax=Elysia crispata TaxID=231223 RepID=A0AAE0XZ80_9GAST|nr:hypothetical protein RRG08_049892 [Elysia crispata]
MREKRKRKAERQILEKRKRRAGSHWKGGKMKRGAENEGKRKEKAKILLTKTQVKEPKATEWEVKRRVEGKRTQREKEWREGFTANG